MSAWSGPGAWRAHLTYHIIYIKMTIILFAKYYFWEHVVKCSTRVPAANSQSFQIAFRRADVAAPRDPLWCAGVLLSAGGALAPMTMPVTCDPVADLAIPHKGPARDCKRRATPDAWWWRTPGPLGRPRSGIEPVRRRADPSRQQLVVFSSWVVRRVVGEGGPKGLWRSVR